MEAEQYQHLQHNQSVFRACSIAAATDQVGLTREMGWIRPRMQKASCQCSRRNAFPASAWEEICTFGDNFVEKGVVLPVPKCQLGRDLQELNNLLVSSRLPPDNVLQLMHPKPIVQRFPELFANYEDLLLHPRRRIRTLQSPCKTRPVLVLT